MYVQEPVRSPRGNHGDDGTNDEGDDDYVFISENSTYL